MTVSKSVLPKKPADFVELGINTDKSGFYGSPTWIRTRDLRINSPSLYRLSYQGIDV